MKDIERKMMMCKLEILQKNKFDDRSIMEIFQ